MDNFAEYLNSFKMCRIPYGTKAPVDKGWQENPISEIETGYQYGILHQFSGTCAIDIDDLEKARELFLEKDISLDFLLMSGVQISSGRENRAKLIYKLPFVLPSKKLQYNHADIVDFRCRGMQDVLPPSIHPDTGQPYTWIGDWRSIPTLPQEIFEWWMDELKGPSQPSTPAPMLDNDKVAHLLKFCDPGMSRMDWIKVGMALQALSDDYFSVWDAWSAQSTEKYAGTQHNLTQWRSFKNHPEGITSRSLEYYARQGGWKPDVEAALKLFKEVDIEDNVSVRFDQTVEPDMPMDVLPELLQEYAAEVARSVGASEVVSVAAGLSAISTAANAQSRLKIQEGFYVPPILWAMTIGDPAAKKSPASKPMMVPFRNLEKEDIPRYTKELNRFVALEAAYVAAQKNYLKEAEKPEFLMNGSKTSDLPFVPEPPQSPTILRFTLNDTTSQKLIDMIAPRPEGMTLFMDEGANWLLKLVGGKSGDDRSMWVVSYEGEPYAFDRVSRGSLYADNLAISIYMNIQPDILSTVLPVLQTDGLLQRFVPFIIPAGKGSTLSDPIPPWMSKLPQWENLLRRIYAAGKREYYLSEAAHKKFREFELWIEEHKHIHTTVQTNSGFQSTLGKFAGLLGRITLLFHLGTSPELYEIGEKQVGLAIEFMKKYVYWSVYALYCLAGNEGFDRWVFDWIVTGDEEVFSDSDLRRSARRQLQEKNTYEQKEITYMSLQYMCSLGIIMEIEADDRRITRYAVNPQLRAKFNGRRREVASMKQRLLDESAEIVRQKKGRAIPRKIARGYQDEIKN